MSLLGSHNALHLMSPFLMQEGEVLYIPKKWWHQVQALSNSLSFSYWWT